MTRYGSDALQASLGYQTTNDVRSVPAVPQLTTIGHRPLVVRVPTIQVHETLPAVGVFGYNPCAPDDPLL
jgi:hypothetical protein